LAFIRQINADKKQRNLVGHFRLTCLFVWFR
jgi:hypothetical protein